ncbi:MULTISPECIES: hypothetical protein [unclassified Streptomyces]|uniref:hypothetical protein n=1 Tax=unclassified Streptomyces TaxID=2593676 RepID=UPI0033B248F3
MPRISRSAARVSPADSLEPALPAQAVETFTLVVTGVTANAPRHGGNRFTVRRSTGVDTVSIAMSDPGPAPYADGFVMR